MIKQPKLHAYFISFFNLLLIKQSWGFKPVNLWFCVFGFPTSQRQYILWCRGATQCYYLSAGMFLLLLDKNQRAMSPEMLENTGKN